MKEDQIKLAFSKVKQDISFLKEEISIIKKDQEELKKLLKTLYNDFNTQKLHQINDSTLRQINSTHPGTSTDLSTVPQEVGGLKPQNLGISTGNEGVSTDRQTDRQTDNSTHFSSLSIESNIQKASEILDSLDSLKKEIRLKFKRVTTQEMAVFSTIYQLEEQNPDQTTYQQLAKQLNLSESSVRDYVQKMVNKGIPIKKHKINNKKVVFSISPKLKEIATLSTILKLREL